MRVVTCLGNPNSPHLNQWLRLLEDGGYSVKVITHVKSDHPKIASSYEYLLPKWCNFFPASMLYVVAGFCLRWRGGVSKLHAHNTSGYGLMAYISGASYIITTYGSEIYTAPDKSWLYRHMIKKILKTAAAITTTSPKMTSAIKKLFPDVKSQIHEFSLGFDKAFYYSKEEGDLLRGNFGITTAETVWIINRRVHPLYRTEEVVKAFVRFSKLNEGHFLFVMQGDCDQDYYKKIRHKYGCCSNIFFVNGFVGQDILRSYLSASDYAISTPVTDQLSSSILEALACGVFPVLSSNDAYAPVSAMSVQYNLDCEDDFDRIFNLHFEYNKDEMARLQRIQTVGLNFSKAAVLARIGMLYGNHQA